MNVSLGRPCVLVRYATRGESLNGGLLCARQHRALARSYGFVAGIAGDPKPSFSKRESGMPTQLQLRLVAREMEWTKTGPIADWHEQTWKLCRGAKQQTGEPRGNCGCGQAQRIRNIDAVARRPGRSQCLAHVSPRADFFRIDDVVRFTKRR